MAAGEALVAGIAIPSTSPMFLAVVGVHLTAALVCTVSGATAMLSRKARGQHSRFGAIYFWSLAVVFGTAAGLSAVRWADDYPLFALGAAAFAAALVGRTAARRRRPNWTAPHMVGMASSYVLMLTAFYVDNGKSLPLWKSLPAIAYWLAPMAVGLPILIGVCLTHPLLRREPR